MAHLFDIIHPNFFSVLASPRKNTYIDCIFIIYNAVDSIEESFQGDREYVVHRLIDYFDDKVNDEFSEETDNEATRTSRQKANHVINLLKRNGWLGEEELGDYKTSLNFFDYSIKVISVLDDVLNARQDEYTGEIFAVYSLLNAFTIDEGVGIIEQSFRKTEDIIKKLKTLKANIYRYYFDITKNRTKQDLQDILEKLLVEYKENFFDSAYYNMKTRDSLPRYKRGILSGVVNIYDNVETMDKLAHLVMEQKRIENYNDAFDYVETKLRFITDSFSVLDNLILDIDRKNEQYISATASKILYLTNHSDDVEGIFNRLFKIVLEDDEFEYNDILNLRQIRNLDTESLYNQRRTRIDSDPEELEIGFDVISEDEIKNQISSMFIYERYSKKEINNHALKILLENGSIKASEINITDQESYVKLMLVYLYSQSTSIGYEIEQLDYVTKNNFVSFRDFIIRKKGGRA